MTLPNARCIALVAGLSLALTGAATAQTRDLADAPDRVPTLVDPDKPADMVFSAQSHDFGIISDDAPVEHVFRFRNEGLGTLRISSTKGSCACTVPAPSKRAFQPGEEGEIRVIYDPSGKMGEQTQIVTINTNDAETPVISLQVKAMVVPQVMVQPRIGHFGEVPKDQPAEVEIRVIGRAMGFEVTGVELSDTEFFRAEVGETVEVRLEPEENAELLQMNAEQAESESPEKAAETVRECVIKVHMMPGHDIGLVRNKFLTVKTNDEKRPEIRVELMAQHAGDIMMTPRRVQLGSLPGGAAFQREVTFRSLSGRPFRVLGIEHSAVAADAVDYSFAPVDPDNPVAYRLTIDGEMPADARVLRGRFIIQTDVEREEQLYLHYYGQLRPEARTGGG
jgi:hypothetical protein